MNTPDDRGFLKAAEREWARQEEALRRERAGEPEPRGSAEPAVAEYRLIARALRHPPMEALPDDFASQVATLAQAAAEADDRLERLLQRGLTGLLALAAAVVTAMYGQAWWPAIASAVPVASGEGGAWIATAVVGAGLMGWAGRYVERLAARGPAVGA